MTLIEQMFDQAVKFHRAGNAQQAEQYCRYILQADPRHVDALYLLGTLCRELGRSDLALTYIGESVRLRPNFPKAHNDLGGLFANQGRLDEAIACLRQALLLDPNYAGAYGNLGSLLERQGKLEEAAVCCRQALRLAPGFAELHCNLGGVLRQQGQLDEAVACYRQALRIQPGHADAHSALGIVLQKQGKFDEAGACYQQALRLAPDNAEAHFNRGFHLLLHGDFQEGWRELEWRWRLRSYQTRPFAQPRWDGADLTGKTILLNAEQGIGDTVQFVRYAALVHKRGGTVVFECPDHLVPLFGRLAGVDRLVPRDSPLPAFDVHMPLLSAPAIFGTTLTSIPADVPYLAAEQDLVERWGHELQTAQPCFRVGIVWQGNPKHHADRYRSFPLACFEPLAHIGGVRLFSLQKGPGSEQLGQMAGRLPIVDLGPRLDSFVDTAAIMKNLDLVVTADTAPAHVAGALAVPVWVALTFAPDWRWLLKREDSPWYPTMRLFRQTAWGDWQGVFQRMAKELAGLVNLKLKA